jgi:hypothetical protein
MRKKKKNTALKLAWTSQGNAGDSINKKMCNLRQHTVLYVWACSAKYCITVEINQDLVKATVFLLVIVGFVVGFGAQPLSCWYVTNDAVGSGRPPISLFGPSLATTRYSSQY